MKFLLNINSTFSQLKKLSIVNNLDSFNFRWPGRAHDARVWQKSPLSKKLAELCYVHGRHLDESYHILGYTAYPLSNHLITPYRI